LYISTFGSILPCTTRPHHTFHSCSHKSQAQNSNVDLFFDHNNVFDENKTKTNENYATYGVFIIHLQKPTEQEIQYFLNVAALTLRHFAVQVEQILVQQGQDAVVALIAQILESGANRFRALGDLLVGIEDLLVRRLQPNDGHFLQKSDAAINS